MSIRDRLIVLGGLTILMFVTLVLLIQNNIHTLIAAQSEVSKGSNIIIYLEDIKAAAYATIELDPTSKDTFDVFHMGEKSITMAKAQIEPILNSDEKANFDTIMQEWKAYDQQSWNNIVLARKNPAKANAQLVPIYHNVFGASGVVVGGQQV